MKAKDLAHNLKVIKKLRANSPTRQADPGDGQRLARVMKTEPAVNARKPPTELMQEHLKYKGGPTGEEIEGRV